MPSFMTIGCQMPEYTGGGLPPPPYKIGSQNTPYNLGLKVWNLQGTKDYLSSKIPGPSTGYFVSKRSLLNSKFKGPDNDLS